MFCIRVLCDSSSYFFLHLYKKKLLKLSAQFHIIDTLSNFIYLFNFCSFFSFAIKYTLTNLSEHSKKQNILIN